MYFVNHGGGCCGIKHIFGFPQELDAKYPARDVREHAKYNGYRLAFTVGDRFPASEPAETALEKFDRYIGYFDQIRNSGVLEVILAESEWGHLNQMHWLPELKKRGFVEVTANLNSNSLNTIHIYHRCMLKGKCLGLATLAKKPAKPKAKSVKKKVTD